MAPDEIILVIGPEQERIRVSAAALRLASTVFHKMLGPNFLEGRQQEISLPEDDPVGMRLVVGTVMYERAPARMDGDAIGSLAALADKYDVRPAWHLVELLLQRCEPSVFDPADAIGYLHAALLFDDPLLFSRVSAVVLWVYSPTDVEPALSQLDAKIVVLISILEARRTQIRGALFKACAGEIATMKSLGGHNIQGYRSSAILITALFSDIHTYQSLKSVVAGFPAFPQSSGKPQVTPELKNIFRDLGNHLVGAFELAKLPCVNGIGLCIDCVKKIMLDAEGQCRQIPPLPGGAVDTLGLSPHFYRRQM